MEEKRDNIFKQFVLSFFSFKHYPSFTRARGGKVFLYTLLMVCITYVVTCIIPTSEFLPYIFQIDTEIVDEYVPYFEISNGEFYIEEEFYYEDEDASIIIYATSDYVVPSDVANEILSAYTQGFIISSDEMVIKQATGVVDTYAFSMMPDVSRDALYDLIPVIKVVTVVVYVLIFICYIGVYLFGALICALIAQLVNLFIKAPVTFGSIFKMTAYARTAPIILKMIVSLFIGGLGFFFVIFYGLYIFYMVMGLTALKNEAEAIPESPTPYGPANDDTPIEN